jgi:hypothetical protein
VKKYIAWGRPGKEGRPAYLPFTLRLSAWTAADWRLIEPGFRLACVSQNIVAKRLREIV